MSISKAFVLGILGISLLTSAVLAMSSADPLPQKPSSRGQAAQAARPVKTAPSMPTPNKAQGVPTPTVNPATIQASALKEKNDSARENELSLKLKWVDFWITIPGLLTSIILAFLGNRKSEAGKTVAGVTLSGFGVIAGISVVGILFLLVVLPRRADVTTQPSSDYLRTEFAKMWSEKDRMNKTLTDRGKSAEHLLQQIGEIKQRSDAIESRLREMAITSRELAAASEKGQAEFPSQSALLNSVFSLTSEVRQAQVTIGRLQSSLEQIEDQNTKVSRLGFVFIGIIAIMVTAAVIALGLLAWRQLVRYGYLIERQQDRSMKMQEDFEHEFRHLSKRLQEQEELIKRGANTM